MGKVNVYITKQPKGTDVPYVGRINMGDEPRYEEDNEPDGYYGEDMRCGSCEGYMLWCSCCEVYTQTCCVDYGTCMCS